jgi:hypothetical protein
LKLVKKVNFNFRSACGLGIISLFVSFLAASAPHRVHHLLEDLQLPPDHERGSHVTSRLAMVEHDVAYGDTNQAGATEHAGASQQDRNHDTAPKTDCVLQSAASHSQLSPSQPLAVINRVAVFTLPIHAGVESLTNFNRSSCSQRAPPRL